MNDEIKWYCLKQKNTNNFLSRKNFDIQLIENSNCPIIGCSKDEMKIDYFEEIERLGLEVVECE